MKCSFVEIVNAGKVVTVSYYLRNNLLCVVLNASSPRKREFTEKRIL